MSDAMHGMGGGEEARSPQMETLNRVIAEVIVEPRPPGGAQRVSRLQNPAQAGTRAAAHEPEMAAALLRHQFENDAGFAVALDAEHSAFVGPLYRGYVCASPSFRDGPKGRARNPYSRSVVMDSGLFASLGPGKTN